MIKIYKPSPCNIKEYRLIYRDFSYRNFEISENDRKILLYPKNAFGEIDPTYGSCYHELNSVIYIYSLSGLAYYIENEVGINFEYGETEHLYVNGGIESIPKLSFINFSINHKGYFKKIKNLDFYGILEYKFSKYTIFEKKEFGGTITSGFSPQAVNVLLSVGKKMLYGEIGFHYDAGPRPAIMQLTNSDNQSALIFGVEFKKRFNDFIYTSLIRYILTFPTQIVYFFHPPWEKITYENDFGDHIIFHSEIVHKMRFISLGICFLYRYITKGKQVDKNSGDVSIYESGCHISFYPFLKLNFSKFPVSLKISISLSDEYFPYGISIYGKNSIVTFKCISFNFSYHPQIKGD